MPEAARSVLLFLFSFSGRMERAVYGLFLFVLSPLVFLRHLGGRAFHDGLMGAPLRWALLLFGFILIAILFSAMARRMHDFNMRAGWALAVPLLAHFLPFLPMLFMLALLLIPGTKGANRFGPVPRTWQGMKAGFALRRLSRDYAAGRIDTAAFNAAREKIPSPTNGHE